MGLIVERSIVSLFTTSIISAILMVSVFYLLHWVIKRYLPELLATKEEDDSAHLDIMTGSDSNPVIEGEEAEYIDESAAIDDNNFTLRDHLSLAPKIDPKKEKFYQESPENLAKMVRTSLMKDDK